MKRTSPLTAFLGLAVLAFCVSACSLNERVHNMGPEVTADLVVYFKADTTQEQIEGFWENVLSYPDPGGRGQFLRPGVGRLSRVESVEGHEGIAIIFYWDAWNSERAQLRRGIDESQLVFAVVENIAPQDVKTLNGHDASLGGDIQQSLAADGAIACFSSNLVPSAWMLFARRS